MLASPPIPTYVYRITHYLNLPFILENGICCPNHQVQDPHYINIGHKSLIDLRGLTKVKVEPFGVLNDYIPFYFTKKAPMLYLIHKKNVPDYSGDQSEIVYLITSVQEVEKAGMGFVFTDRHAKLSYVNFYNKLADLDKVDWEVILSRDWYNTPTQYDRKEKKQAEFLVYQHMPVRILLGIACYNDRILRTIRQMITKVSSTIPTKALPSWYY